MSPESPGNLVALDLQWMGRQLECQVDRFDPRPPSGDFLYVSWNAIECPDQYVPVGNGVAYVWVPPNFDHRQYRARIDVAGNGYEWIDRAAGLGLMFVVTLPKEHLYTFPREDEPGPRPIRFKPTAEGRLALYWWLKGDTPDGRAAVTWCMSHAPGTDIAAQCTLLNESARRANAPDAYPVHMELSPRAGADVLSNQPPILKEPPSWHTGITIHAASVTMNSSTHFTTQVSNSPGAIANVAQHMSDVTSHVAQQVRGSATSEEIEELMKELADRIARISPSVNPEKTEQMVGDLKTLNNELAKSEPRRKWYELSLEGIKEAASSIGEIGVPILETVTKLMPLLLRASS